MALRNYGVLKGRPIDRRLGAGSSPHYQIRIVDDTDDYRIAVNVKSKLAPSELLYLVDGQFSHPIVEDLRELSMGFSEIPSQPGGVAMDYIRANLFDFNQMIPLPFNVPGPDNDLNEKIDAIIQRAMADESAMVYAFGERWGPESGKKDKYFGFAPGNGIHDIHMNQGSEGQFKETNGVWQDGGLLVHFGSENRWAGIFLAFQSQCQHTDDESGDCTGPPDPVEDVEVVIVAAMVNPSGHDPGLERVLLLNTAAVDVDLRGWRLADKNKRSHLLPDEVLPSGEVLAIPLPGDTIQLSNKGGIITLLNEEGLKIHGVKYTKEAAAQQGRTIVF